MLCAPRDWLQRPADVAPHDWADRPDAPFVVPELVQDAATPAALATAPATRQLLEPVYIAEGVIEAARRAGERT